jgi:DNA-binding CsgD family transcriptional regulator/tetratricopeptide (TPR) repeat protein
MAMPELVGRDVELIALGEVLGGLRAGRGRAVLVTGEAGIGKSALVTTALARADFHLTRIVTGVCDELTEQFPLSVVKQAVRLKDGMGRGPGRDAVPGPGPVMGHPVQAAVEELLGVVQGWCAAGPVVLVLEDLHWADEASVLWWRRLCRLTGQLPLVLAGTRRPVPRAPEADVLARQVQADGGLVLPLSGLAPGAVRAMAAELNGGVPGPQLLSWLEHANGNPFYVRELVDEAARSGALPMTSGAVDLAGAAGGPRGADGGRWGDSILLRAAVESRLDFLSEDAMRVLRIAALLGPEFLVSDLAAVCERTPAALLPVLEDSFAAGVLEESGALVRFRHGLLQQALYDGIPGPVRAALHRQAARTLIELDAPAERVARQLLAVPAADAVAGWEVTWLADRVAELVRRVPEVAAELLERVLRQAWPENSLRSRLEDYLLEALFVLGRFERTEQLARDVLPRVSDPDRYGQVAWPMVYALMRLRRYRDAEAALAAAAGRSDVSAIWQARFFALRAMLARYTSSRPQAAHYASVALTSGRDLGDATATAYALHSLSVLHFDQGDLKTSCRLTDAALAAAERDPRLGDLWLMLTYNRAGMTADLENYEEAWTLARDALARHELSGSRRLRRLHGMAAAIAYQIGSWDEALAELDAGAEDDDDDDEAESPYLRVLIAGHRDEWPEVEGRLAALKRSTNGYLPPPWDSSPSMSTKIVAVAVLDLERSREPERAASLLAQWLDPGQQDRLLPFIDRSLPSFVRLCLMTGDEAAARAAAQAAGQEADRYPLASKQAAAQWCTGLVRGDPAPVQKAAGSFRDLGLPLYAGGAFEDAAVLLAQANAAAPARTALRDALQLYGQVGAAWDARRAASRVRRFGIRSGVRGPRRRPQTGWKALTGMERQVAELVAAGCSNPDIARQLFISRRTVESHVSRILAKLQISSRWEVKTIAEQAAAEQP